jgi:hypothetical protein
MRGAPARHRSVRGGPFSKDEHRKWAHGRTSGPDVLRLNILGKLDAVRERLVALSPGARPPGADPMLYPGDR